MSNRKQQMATTALLTIGVGVSVTNAGPIDWTMHPHEVTGPNESGWASPNVSGDLELVNIWSPIPYAAWEGLILDWGGTGTTSWDFAWRTTNITEDVTIIDARAYLVDLKVDHYLTYLGDGVWQGANGLQGTMTNFVGVDYAPEELIIFPDSFNPDLPYPYVELGDLAPGESVDSSWHVEWVNMPSWWYAVIQGDTIGWVPEPATLTLLALGGLAILRRKRQ